MAENLDGENGLRAGFRDPPTAEYGNVPFWWWDGDELSEQRLTDQLETLKEQGVAAVCFQQKYPHGPPEGPQAPYFSEEWWRYLEHVVRECDRLGISLWIHDLTYHHSPPRWKRYWQNRVEDEIDERPEFQGRVLDRIATTVDAGETATLELPEEFEVRSVAAYPVVDGERTNELTLNPSEAIDLNDACVNENGAHNGGTKIIEWTAPTDWNGTWHAAAVGTRPEGLCRTTRDVVDRIIKRHYGAYVERLGDALGDPIVGTFQDELYMLQAQVPCDERLLARYRAEWGEEPALIALFENCGPETRTLRARYYDVVVTMLEENWFRPLYQWHERRGLQFAHDNWGRNDITEHATEYGDYVRTMRWFQEPGYDDGGTFEGVGTRNFFDAKLAASIAACYNRDRVWGELFHTTGWGFPLDLHLAGIAENACYGLNRYNKHGLYYATRGGWYEHAAPDTHFRQPYWEQMDAFNDAVARLMYLCSRGDPVVDVAMHYPIASVQTARLVGEPEVDGSGGHYRPEFEPEATEIDERTREIAEGVYRNVADLLLVDHETLVDADVANGRLAFAGQETDVLLLGPTTIVHESVLERAEALVANGGCVVSIGRLPTSTIENGTGAAAPILERLFGEAATDRDPPTVVDHEDGGVAIIADIGIADDRGDESRTSEPEDSESTGWDALADTLDQYVDRDLRVPADVLSTHRRVGDLDLYLLLNTRAEARTVEVELRATGRPERWDVHDGTVEPIYTFDRAGDYTTIELAFAPHEFHVIGIDRTASPDTSVVDTTLDTVERIETTGDGVRVEGFAREGGVHEASVANDEEVWTATSDPVSVPDSVELTEWEFELEPTLDNTWGDVRYPPGGEVGPEVREFAHRVEARDEDGLEAGWHESAVDSKGWEPLRWSTGSWFWHRPTKEGDEAGVPALSEVDEWEPYQFSTLTGKPGTHPDDHGLNGIIGEDFLVSLPEEPTCFWTTVSADEEGAVACHHGTGIRSLTIDGEPVALEKEGTVTVDLPAGATPVTLVVEPDVETHLAFESLPAEAPDLEMAHVPRLRWFQADGTLPFDPRPWTDDHVDWFRFEAPVGATALSLPIDGSARVWVDGEERPLENGRVDLEGSEGPLLESTAVAVRSVHPTRYGGARLTGPVTFETVLVTVEPGDWCDLGLAEYSGIGVYRTELSLPDHREGDRLVLELGDVGVSASVSVDGEVVGTAFAPPYEVDLTGAAEGSILEIRVANTLANHFATETPTRYVYDGQRRSGLFAPVTLRTKRAVTVSDADGSGR